jgi:hypothetical protein
VFNRYDLDVLADAARVTGLRYHALMCEHDAAKMEADAAKRRVEEGLKLTQNLEQQIMALRDAAVGTFGIRDSLKKVTQGRGRDEAAAGAIIKRSSSNSALLKGTPPEPQVAAHRLYLCAHMLMNAQRLYLCQHMLKNIAKAISVSKFADDHDTVSRPTQKHACPYTYVYATLQIAHVSTRSRADEGDHRHDDPSEKTAKDSAVKMSEEAAKDAGQDRGSGKMDKMIESKKQAPEKEKPSLDKGKTSKTVELYDVQGFPELDQMFDHVHKVCICMYVGTRLASVTQP